ncbi:hypothetical protein B0T24DRAFT_602440 [Lasiosphaeria ovina]|uniref:Uncharacterized protein n=1 Tax=Lasiosphaeria ovina TaxID=92902 RepID=A0AAE0TX68_9PEZI|nr:hypothetical protein B0T24DRAFT_602440 [Lasiosphaeria ovina]
MLANSYSSELDMDAGDAPSLQSYFESNPGYVPWTGAEGADSRVVADNTSNTQYVNPWHGSLPGPDYDDPTMFGADGAEIDWSSFGPLPSSSHQHHHNNNTWGHPDPSPVDYFTSGLPASPGGLYTASSVWGSHDQPLYSPHSEAPPLIPAHHAPLVRSVSAENGLSAGSSLDFIRRPNLKHGGSSSEPTSPGNMVLVSSSPVAAALPSNTTKPKRAHKAKAKSVSASKSDAKSKKAAGSCTSSSSHPQQQRGSSSSSSKRKSQSPPLTPGGTPATAAASAEQIRKEAWRICKAEALEMSQRRIMLIEHERGALERETQKLQVNIGRMREAVSREEASLRDAVLKAESLARSY